MENLPVLYIPNDSLTLKDNEQWQFRFEIHSETSDRIYIIAQNKAKKHWGCSCPSYRTRRYCKHLATLNLPSHERPFEVIVK
jgi:hypothetical protein